MNVASPTFANPLFRQAIVRAVDRDDGRHRRHPRPRARARRSSRPACPVRRRTPAAIACNYDPDGGQGAAGPGVPRRGHPDGRDRHRRRPGLGEAGLGRAARSGGGRHPGRGQGHAAGRVPALRHHRPAAAVPHRLGGSGSLGCGLPRPAVPLGLARQHDVVLLGRSSTPRLADALATQDPTARNQQYAAIETSILGQSPVLPLGSYLTAVALSSGVRDYKPRLDGTFAIDSIQVAESTTSTSGG